MSKWGKRVLSVLLAMVLVSGGSFAGDIPIRAASVGTIAFDEASYFCDTNGHITLTLTITTGDDDIDVSFNSVSFTCNDSSALTFTQYATPNSSTTPGKYSVVISVTANRTGAYAITSTISNGQTATTTVYVSVYPLTVVNGSGSGIYAAGVNVSINANAAPSGEGFYKWAATNGFSSNVVIPNETSESTTIRMPSSAATVTALYAKTPDSKYIKKAAKDWLSAYDKYISSVRKEAKKEAKLLNDEDPQDVFEEAAKKMQLTGEWDYINDTKERALAQTSAQQGLLGMLVESDYYKKNLDLSSINNNDIDVFALNVVKNITKSFYSLKTPRKQYGKYYVKISGLGLGQSLTGSITLTDSTDSSTNYTGILNANASQAASVLAEYIKEMTILSGNAYKVALEEVAKDLTGYTFKDLLANKVNDYLKDHGFGAVNEVLGKCNELYSIAVKCKSMPVKGNAEDWYSWAKSMESKASSYFVNQGSFSNSVINGAFHKMDDARKHLYDSVVAYSSGRGYQTPEEDKTVWDNISDYFSSSWKCPVNIYVYDGNNTLIGFIDEDEATALTDAIIIAKDGDEKTVCYQKGADIRFEVVGTDYGLLNVSFDEYQDNEPVKRMNFFNIVLEKGKEIRGSFNYPSLEQAKNSFTLSSDGKAITSDQFLQLDSPTITIAVNVDGSGIVLNSGTYYSGDGVTLVAEPSSSQVFDGWYNGNDCVSDDRVYQFTATNSLVLTAKFAASVYQSYDNSNVVTFGDFTYTVLNSEATLKKYTGTTSEVVIPDKIGNIPVTAISGGGYVNGAYYGGAFSDCITMKSIDIPNTVTSIGFLAFYNCTSLTNIVIPDSVIMLGEYQGSNRYMVFSGCTALTSATIGSGVILRQNPFDDAPIENLTINTSTIPDRTFIGFDTLKYLTIGDNVTSIGIHAFGDGHFVNGGCSSLTEVIIGNNVRSIGDFAFTGCTSLERINIPNSVTSLGIGVFSDCVSLKRIDLPDSILSLGDGMFSHCTALSDVTLPDSVTNIGYGAFYGCTSLADIILPSKLTLVDGAAFINCISLTNITIPDGVTSIESNAFENCTSLTRITIPRSVNYIEFWALRNNQIITIYCYKNSYAHEFAIEMSNWSSNNIVFVLLDDDGINKVVLNARINETLNSTYKGFYSTESWIAYQTAFSIAQTVLDDSSATQTQIDSALNNLNTAYASLVTVSPQPSYTVTLDPVGGDVSPMQITVINGRTYSALPIPTLERYTFDGWYTTASGGTRVNSTDIVSLTENITLYAIWKAPDAMLLGSARSIKIEKGGQIKYFSFTPTVSGVYEFFSTGDIDTYGYLYDANGNQLVTDDDSGEGNNFRISYNFTAGITYSFGAKLYNSNATGSFDVVLVREGETISSYTLTLAPNGGTVAPMTVTQVTGSTYALPNPTRNGYIFTGWVLSGGGSLSGSTYTFGTSNGILTAQWKVNAINYTVTVNSGTGGGSNYAQGATVTITANAAPSGKVFDKWITSDGVSFTNANSATTTFTMPGKNVTVTATFKEETAAKKHINLWGRQTKYESNFWNWLLCIVCFGWIWMAF